ncbi:2-phospho-L-lactate guanylyltransferase [Rhodopseudomonas sp. HC1]|uniref:2-phospho-L-lactate guanylyltransferase n=1 Tax=Rhodopseudomonas infernalis TaxID=2897386 RepID=UPI001EE89AD9|nr:2-phospho-L-lactate guanylyltransferase [Rhodopseudomonas infernalis]MCG6204231.1 2-phospho-L-lactate guanylyltransferase [Rhodopseudomonas infernalis]
MTHVLIPCKPLDCGKSRLAGALDPSGRRWLCERMLRQTLAAAAAAFGAEQVRVVSADAQVRRVAATWGVGVIDDRTHDLNGALGNARHELQRTIATLTRLMILPIDLPYVEPVILRRVAAEQAAVVIVPDRKFDGTNLLCVDARTAASFPFAYGPRSFQHHFGAARRLGVTPAILVDQRLAFDLDLPDDYRQWAEHVAA